MALSVAWFSTLRDQPGSIHIIAFRPDGIGWFGSTNKNFITAI
jgi:hypothetical protein